ncbi:terminase gpA endonuclease subunit, partial [Pontibaca methylaminivorans]|uniref:terminase gpA endonuclease subunit n=1 Tax=Pontibaca methylaminivorans TaxID=515897 RepID=UPI002FDB0C56
TSERAVVRYRRGAPVRSFERIAGRRAETLDTAVYALAARQLVTIDPERRRAELSSDRNATPRAGPVLQSQWMTKR